MLSALRALFTTPPTEQELAFRETLLSYAHCRKLAPNEGDGDIRELIGAVAADVFLRANIAEQLESSADAHTCVYRAAFACHGLARRAGVPFNVSMIQTAAHRLGAPRPLPKSIRAVIWDALNMVEEERLFGSLPEQAEEVMVPRFIRREEPLVLKHLSDQLTKQLRLAREEDKALPENAASP